MWIRWCPLHDRRTAGLRTGARRGGLRQAMPTLRPRRADPRHISTSTLSKGAQRTARPARFQAQLDLS